MTDGPEVFYVKVSKQDTYALKSYSWTWKIEPAHDKTYYKTCVTSEDSDQPVLQLSMARGSRSPLFG